MSLVPTHPPFLLILFFLTDRRSQCFPLHFSVSNSSSNSDPEACTSTLADGTDTLASCKMGLPSHKITERDEDFLNPVQRQNPRQTFDIPAKLSTQRTQELVPLLRKSVSFSGSPPHSYSAVCVGANSLVAVAENSLQSTTIQKPTGKDTVIHHNFGGQSTFGQTVSIALYRIFT